MKKLFASVQCKVHLTANKSKRKHHKILVRTAKETSAQLAHSILASDSLTPTRTSPPEMRPLGYLTSPGGWGVESLQASHCRTPMELVPV